jgi:hypothetical protein
MAVRFFASPPSSSRIRLSIAVTVLAHSVEIDHKRMMARPDVGGCSK